MNNKKDDLMTKVVSIRKGLGAGYYLPSKRGTHHEVLENMKEEENLEKMKVKTN